MSTVSITFRTLKGSTFKLDAAPADTVVDLKRKVAEHQNLHVDNPASYRLIYKGKILNDDATVASSSITDQGFVVVMPPKKQIAKPAKPAAAPAAASVPAATASAPAPASSTPSAPATTTPAAAPASTTPSTAAADTAATSAPASTDAASAPGESLVMGAAYEASVKRIMEMGFPEDQVKRAMRAAYNNPDRAVDYIFNGIPDMPDAPPGGPPASAAPSTGSAATAPSSTTPAPTSTAPSAPAQNPPAAAPRDAPGTPFNMFEPAPAANTQRASAGAGDPAGGAPGGSDLDVLRSNPQFMMMRRLIQANPAVLPQILQQLESVNPALMGLIEANYEEFSRMLSEPLPEGDGVNDEAVDQLSQMMANAAGPGGPGGASGNQIYVTEEENQQILRLTELGATIGLERAHVLETWLACNRDETLAANFLVDHAEELRADQAEEAANAERRNQPEDEQGPGGPPS